MYTKRFTDWRFRIGSEPDWISYNKWQCSGNIHQIISPCQQELIQPTIIGICRELNCPYQLFIITKKFPWTDERKITLFFSVSMSSRAAQLNNQGAALFSQGAVRESLSLLRSALRETLEPSDTQILPAATPPFPVQFRASGRSKEQDSSSTNPTTTQHCMSHPFIYTQAFFLDTTDNAYACDSYLQTTVVSATILFNIGLIFHIKGDTRSLYKARVLYTKSQTLLAQAGLLVTATGHALLDLLILCLYNNLAHTAYECQDYWTCRYSFEALIAYATTVPTQVGTEVDWHKSNFLLNAIILHPPQLAAAA